MNPAIPQQNLSLLHRLHVHAAKGLLEHLRVQREQRIPSPYFVEPGLSGKLTLFKIAANERIDLLPPEFERECADRVQEIRRMPSGAVILWSCGLGRLLQEIASELDRLLLVIIEPEYDILFAALQTIDWSRLFPLPNLLLLTGAKAQPQAVELLETYGSLAQKGFMVLPGRILSSQEQSALDDLQRFMPKSAERSRLLFSTAPKIAVHTAAFAAGSAHVDILPLLQEEAHTIGWRASRVFRPNYWTRFLSKDDSWRECLGDPLPSAIMAFTHTVFSPNQWRSMKEQGVHRVVWCFDDPFRYSLGEEFFNSFDRIYCFDPFHAQRLQILSQAHVEYLPAAAAYSDDLPGNPPPGLPPQMDVTFVGSTGLQRMDESFMRLISQNAPPIQALRNFVERYLVQGQSIPYQEFMEFDLQFPGFSKNRRVILLEDLATFFVRLHFLSSLMDLPIRLFGDLGWSYSSLVGEIASLYQGHPADFIHETPWIYRLSKISLNTFNIQCVDSPTVRLFDVMACGGFLLTEHRPFMEKMFRIGVELETFRTREELRQKINYYLIHEDERRTIALAGQQAVRKNHLYRQRLQRIFQNIPKIK
ncbi:MAG: glycosyltransferase [Candidatus Omnitrophota bacterium]